MLVGPDGRGEIAILGSRKISITDWLQLTVYVYFLNVYWSLYLLKLEMALRARP